jgi:hypothetical protein
MQSRLKLPLGRKPATERVFEIDLFSEESIREAIVTIRREAREAQISGVKLILEIWKDHQPAEGGTDLADANQGREVILSQS